MFRITSHYLDVRYLRTKGQVISKGFFGILNSSKKTNEETQLNYYDTSAANFKKKINLTVLWTSGQIVCVRFFGRIEDTKNPY